MPGPAHAQPPQHGGGLPEALQGQLKAMNGANHKKVQMFLHSLLTQVYFKRKLFIFASNREAGLMACLLHILRNKPAGETHTHVPLLFAQKPVP